MNLIAAAGPPSSSTPFDILTTSPGTTWPRFSRPRATHRAPPALPLSRLSNLRAPSYHPRRHLDQQLRDEMHGNRVEALITPIADSSRSIPDRKNRQLSDILKKESSLSIPSFVVSALPSLLLQGKRLPRWNLRKLVICRRL